MSRESKIKSFEQQIKKGNAVDPKQAKIGEEVQMRVVACAGDPGLTEPWFFDILSRFLICMREPASHVPTNAKAQQMFFLVKRPRHLWVDASGSPDTAKPEAGQTAHSATRRKDYLGNVNIGNPARYSINTIPKLDTDYAVGDTITARRVPVEYATDSNIFVSSFQNGDFVNYYENANKVKLGGKRVGELSVMDGNELKDVMHWSNDHITEHIAGGGGNLALRGGNEWYQLKPLMKAQKRYGGPVKLSRDGMAFTPNTTTKEMAVLTSPQFNKSGAINNTFGIDRTIGTVGENTFWFILHYYLVDLFMRAAHPAYAGTIDKLQTGDHRYQVQGIRQANGTFTHPGTGQVLTDNFGKPVKSSKNLISVNTEVQNLLGKQVVSTRGDNRFLNHNLIFSSVSYTHLTLPTTPYV